MDLNRENIFELNNTTENIIIRTMFNHEFRFIILPPEKFSLDICVPVGSIGRFDRHLNSDVFFISFRFSPSEIQNKWWFACQCYLERQSPYANSSEWVLFDRENLQAQWLILRLLRISRSATESGIYYTRGAIEKHISLITLGFNWFHPIP